MQPSSSLGCRAKPPFVPGRISLLETNTCGFPSPTNLPEDAHHKQAKNPLPNPLRRLSGLRVSCPDGTPPSSLCAISSPAPPLLRWRPERPRARRSLPAEHERRVRAKGIICRGYETQRSVTNRRQPERKDYRPRTDHAGASSTSKQSLLQDASPGPPFQASVHKTPCHLFPPAFPNDVNRLLEGRKRKARERQRKKKKTCIGRDQPRAGIQRTGLKKAQSCPTAGGSAPTCETRAR